MARLSQARVEADRLLFQGRWYPVTKCVSYFAVEPEEWVSMLLDDGDRTVWRVEETYRARTVTGDLEELFGALLPLESSRAGRMLAVRVDTDGPYRTAVFGNCWVGSPLGSERLSFVRRGVELAAVWSWPDNTRGQVWPVQVYGVHEFSVARPAALQPDGTNWESRSVGVRRNSRDWGFGQQGTPLPFEDTFRYLAERDRDKFDQLLLIDYAAALGIRCFDPAAYAPDRTATLIQDLRSPGGSNLLLTLAEAQSDARSGQVGILDTYSKRKAAGLTAM